MLAGLCNVITLLLAYVDKYSFANAVFSGEEYLLISLKHLKYLDKYQVLCLQGQVNTKYLIFCINYQVQVLPNL